MSAVILYALGRNDRPDTPEWQALHQKVEETAATALKKVGGVI
jgi:hypothetical protein